MQLVGQLLDGLVERLQDTIEEHEKAAETGLPSETSKNVDLEAMDLAEITAETTTTVYARSTQKTLSESYSRPRFACDADEGDMIEAVLLLLWRHLLFFANNTNSDPIRPDNLSISLTASKVDGSRSAAGQMRALKNVAADLRGTLQRLSDVQVVSLRL